MNEGAVEWQWSNCKSEKIALHNCILVCRKGQQITE